MKALLLTGAFALLLSACTVTPQNGGLDAQFHPPLLDKHWTTHSYTTREGMQVCAVSSGYNGIIVSLGKTQNGIEAVVASNRIMQPGATLTATVGSSNFETYDTYFPPDIGNKLVQALKGGDKVYLEWSEFSGTAGRERAHIQNIVQLDDFNASLNECKRSLAP